MVRMRRDPFMHLFGEVNRIQEELNRFFGSGTAALAPAFNVWSDDQAFHAETDLPGIDPATLEITVTDGNQLTIKGERKAVEPEGAVCLRQERPTGTFSRVIALPSLIDADKVSAAYEQGVLRLTLPKSEAAKPRKIAVKA